MSDNSKIEWTDATWNPVSGCTKVSPGCDHCYAERVAERFHGKGSFATVQLHPERLDLPLRWRKPHRIFVNSMSDLFHDDVPDEYIAQVFDVMQIASQHTFQILTKRHARMRALLSRWTTRSPEWRRPDGIIDDSHLPMVLDSTAGITGPWPLPNVWLGVSVENQQWADIRIPALLETPAAVRFLSCEPLLGHVDLDEYLDNTCMGCEMGCASYPDCQRPRIDWVIVGGESGPNARPMHPQWARDIRDQCVAADVPFLFKQWGAWAPLKQLPYESCPKSSTGRGDVEGKDVFRVGKKAAGRALDGRTWDEYPA